ncbi:MAG: hypothetical protein ACE5DO_15775, partial [Desulfobacterales bacterium]
MNYIDKEGIANRLIEAISALGFDSNVDFIEKSGINRGTFYALLKDSRKPNSKTMKNLRKIGLNPDWLLTGKGEMLLTKEYKETIKPNRQTVSDESFPQLYGRRKTDEKLRGKLALPDLHQKKKSGEVVDREELYEALFEVLEMLDTTNLHLIRTY